VAVVGHQRAGKNSRTQVGGVNLRNNTWRTTYRADDLDTTNFESGGHEQGTIGVDVIEWSMGGDWDAQQNAYDNPPGLYPRDDLGSVKCYENVSDNVLASIPNNRVLSAENGAEVRGKVSFSANGKSQGGGFALPTGNI
jgi:hypothetical protein